MKEGWTWLINSRKWHYFVEQKSLCGRFLILGTNDLEPSNDDSPDNCAKCHRELQKRIAKQSQIEGAEI